MSTLFSAIFYGNGSGDAISSSTDNCAPFMVIWFFVGHTVESSIISLELVFEHRNYFPAIGLFIGVGCGLQSFHSRLRSEKLRESALLPW